MQKPVFTVITQIKPELAPQIEFAVRDFIKASRLETARVNETGFINQTLECIANATYLGRGGDFWVGTLNGELLIYILAGINTDIDGRLTYHVSQAWVRKSHRGNPIVKEWWNTVRERAKSLFCKHLVITSSRGYRAYERFLGHGIKHYADLLKEEL